MNRRSFLGGVATAAVSSALASDRALALNPSRLRVALSAAHTRDQVRVLRNALDGLGLG